MSKLSVSHGEFLHSLVSNAVSARDLAKEIDVARQAYGGDKLLAELEKLVKDIRRFQREVE